MKRHEDWTKIYLLAAFFILSACNSNLSQSPKKPEGSSARRDTSFITLERISNLGTRPDYKVTVYPDGDIYYDGHGGVDYTGEYKAWVDPDTVRLLFRKLVGFGFFKIVSPYKSIEEATVTKFPVTVITAAAGGQPYRIICGGSNCAAIHQIDFWIDAITGTDRWTGIAKRDRRLVDSLLGIQKRNF